jgi:N-sulfoglucosamine sulfohydrolase
MLKPIKPWQGNTHITLILCLLSFVILFVCAEAAHSEHPNVLWIVAEDTSPWMGCYGDKINALATPHIDSLAESGIRFDRAFVPAPVCSPCRSAMMAGQSQIRFGAHEHRSSRGPVKIHLPRGIKLLPQIMKENGYFTFNLGKTDYNFIWDQEATYSLLGKRSNNIPWETFKQNQPFFGQIQTSGGKTNTKNLTADRRTDPASVTVPPDYPQNQLYREVVAEHFDSIRLEDDTVGRILKGLRASGMAHNTIVVYFSDHGANNLVRHKQMVTEGGLHVPFIIMDPRSDVSKNRVCTDLVSLLDLCATTLAWAGIERPDSYEGQDLFGPGYKARQYVASAKDRMDHTIDRVRTVRTKNFRYTRNYKLDRIFLQPQYRDSRDYVKNLRDLYARRELSPKLTDIYFGERPAEEFYDVNVDPHQLRNLVDDPAYQDELNHHRMLLDEWLGHGDMGEGEEPEAEMKYQADGHKWGSGVNPEYENVRSDSDGDGLSDQWEQINGRDPRDGLLIFEFDCGGWQTEGWQARDIKENIAGYLGYLNFTLDQGSGKLRRYGLSVKATQNDKWLAVKLRVSNQTRIQAYANDKSLSRTQKAAPGGDFVVIRFPLSSNWKGRIESLSLNFKAQKGTFIEIDSIVVERI